MDNGRLQRLKLTSMLIKKRKLKQLWLQKLEYCVNHSKCVQKTEINWNNSHSSFYSLKETLTHLWESSRQTSVQLGDIYTRAKWLQKELKAVSWMESNSEWRFLGDSGMDFEDWHFFSIRKNLERLNRLKFEADVQKSA